MAVAIHFYLAMKKVPNYLSRSERYSLAQTPNDSGHRKCAHRVLVSFPCHRISAGFFGYLLLHKIYLYIFDAVLMLIVMALFNALHPSEVVALVRGGKAAKRGWKMEEIVRYHERVTSDNPRRGLT
jgi:hypothetical protein